MSEKTEITFMQTRLIRLASEEWHLPVEHALDELDTCSRLAKAMQVDGQMEVAGDGTV